MKRGKPITEKKPELKNIQMHGTLCPECSHEVFISAKSAIVMCPECGTNFAIEIPQDEVKVKIPKGLYAI